MNKQLKVKWLKALRSGEYRRAEGTLATMDGKKFCCLGVLADIQGCTWKPDTTEHGLVPLAKNGRALVKGSDDFLPVRRAGGLTSEQQGILADMNDDGKTFKQIAKYIEANL
jgi:hypothetical protein